MLACKWERVSQWNNISAMSEPILAWQKYHFMSIVQKEHISRPILISVWPTFSSSSYFSKRRFQSVSSSYCNLVKCQLLIITQATSSKIKCDCCGILLYSYQHIFFLLVHSSGFDLSESLRKLNLIGIIIEISPSKKGKSGMDICDHEEVENNWNLKNCSLCNRDWEALTIINLVLVRWIERTDSFHGSFQTQLCEGFLVLIFCFIPCLL